MKMNKKAQEEIVGFVIVVVIVAVVFLVLLGIFLRSDSAESARSTEVSQFLESIREYTIECSKDSQLNYIDIEELIRECYSGGNCNNEDSCKLLNSTLSSMLEVAWQVGEERPLKGYIFKANYETNQSSTLIVELAKGNCQGNYLGAESISKAFSGNIINELIVCY